MPSAEAGRPDRACGQAATLPATRASVHSSVMPCSQVRTRIQVTRPEKLLRS